MNWIKTTDKYPEFGEPVLVVKHYVDAWIDAETGGYTDENYPTPSFIGIDRCFVPPCWDKGGVVTHWMPLPELPHEN